MEVLHDILSGFRHAYIVIDALDECSEPELDDLLSFIEEVAEWKHGSLHFLVTCRPIRYILKALKPIILNNIDLRHALLIEDIRIHIRERLQNDRLLREWPMEVKDEIEGCLMKGADGM
jgi:hypothetical protein